MKKFRKLAALTLAGILSVGLLSSCGSSGQTALKVGASAAPHAEILENVVKGLLEKEGITLDVVTYDEYVLPNTHVEDGTIDANYFQHITYMNSFNADNGTHLVSVASIHYEPFGIYAGKSASLDAIPDGGVVAIPNDPTNGGRALLLLQEQGLIKLKDGSGLEPTVADITENPRNLDIMELAAHLLAPTLQDVDVAVINGNYAIEAGLKVSDALAIESAEGEAATAYANVLAVKEGRENEEAIQKLADALQSQEVKDYIDQNYGGAVVALF